MSNSANSSVSSVPVMTLDDVRFHVGENLPVHGVVANVGGYDYETDTGSRDSVFPPLWVVEFHRGVNGKPFLTSPTFSTMRQAEAHRNASLCIAA